MRSPLNLLCRIVIAVGIGIFAGGSIIVLSIQSDARTEASELYNRPMKWKRCGPDVIIWRYITPPQEQILAITTPVIAISFVLAFLAGATLAGLDDARRDEERRRERQHPTEIPEVS